MGDDDLQVHFWQTVVLNRNWELASELEAQGASWVKGTGSVQSPLHFACTRGDAELARRALAGAPNAHLAYDDTEVLLPIHLAAQVGAYL